MNRGGCPLPGPVAGDRRRSQAHGKGARPRRRRGSRRPSAAPGSTRGRRIGVARPRAQRRRHGHPCDDRVSFGGRAQPQADLRDQVRVQSCLDRRPRSCQLGQQGLRLLVYDDDGGPALRAVGIQGAERLDRGEGGHGAVGDDPRDASPACRIIRRQRPGGYERRRERAGPRSAARRRNAPATAARARWYRD